ncbi:FdtA/QdtA family cupin domain-containing protein [Thiomicrospira sp. R3]|uniref:sugar 3,4-ketoisomerase n=1 Tax=Thiomicrospira sp. R3 TaxID=3035472 RepID=UPI00259B8AC8|nr:FdtA/QdtA family cupin domain-containing protein [Thiomicrospira sp. R3]WFE68822.1 FdtA/QdtA family cupin domain-containing protein [Thiomicrospira sp. R3]
MTISEHKILGDERGQLVAIEAERQVPFEIKRVFYIYGTKENIPRGNHSHYKTKQYLISVAGSCKVTLDDGKGGKTTYDLDSPNKGLFQDALIWGTMHDFSEDNVLLVFADDYYKKEDYITDYNEFIKVVNA